MKTIKIERDLVTSFPVTGVRGVRVSTEGLMAASDDENIVRATIEPDHTGAAVITLVPALKPLRKKHALVVFGTPDESHELRVKVIDPPMVSRGRNPDMKISYTTEGIEIDHGSRDLSAALRNGVIEVGIGEGYGDGPGGSYISWADINLTIDEVRAFRDWLTSKIKLATRHE